MSTTLPALPTLLTPYALSQLAGEPHTVIRLLNLQTVLPVGTDAWGRSDIPQPVLISACISLSEPFASASSTDAVTGSTVHYGILSKAILGACEEFGGKDRERGERSLYALVMYLQAFITGVVSSLQEGEQGQGGMRMLKVEVRLPKGSLLGSSISLKGSFFYGDSNAGESRMKGPTSHSMVLRLHELRIPTLIGVNPNERLAKQMVVASIDIERWQHVPDQYHFLEELVVKTISASSFETLEALTSYLGAAITKHFIDENYVSFAIESILAGNGTPSFPKIRIALAKPTAVMFADAPVVQVLLETDPFRSQAVRQLWEEVVEDRKKAPSNVMEYDG